MVAWSSFPPPCPGALRALFVDDDASCARAYARLLSDSGIEAVIATSVADARRHFVPGEATLDVVITDLRLPDGTGFDVVDAARERDAAVPVLLLTGWRDEASSTAAVEHGVDRYLDKPVDIDSLLAEVLEAARRGFRNRRARNR